MPWDLENSNGRKVSILNEGDESQPQPPQRPAYTTRHVSSYDRPLSRPSPAVRHSSSQDPWPRYRARSDVPDLSRSTSHDSYEGSDQHDPPTPQDGYYTPGPMRLSMRLPDSDEPRKEVVRSPYMEEGPRSPYELRPLEQDVRLSPAQRPVTTMSRGATAYDYDDRAPPYERRSMDQDMHLSPAQRPVTSMSRSATAYDYDDRAPDPHTKPQSNEVPDKKAKRYPCKFREKYSCDKTFTTSGHASRHSKIHTSEKAVDCTHPGCPKKFTRSDNMKQHLETHNKAEKQGRATGSGITAPRPSTSRRSSNARLPNSGRVEKTPLPASPGLHARHAPFFESQFQHGSLTSRPHIRQHANNQHVSGLEALTAAAESLEYRQGPESP